MDSTTPEGPDGVRRGFPVETPIGVMYLRHVGWGVLIDNHSNTSPHREGRPYLTVAGKKFTATVGVKPDGTIERAYVSKAGEFGDAAPSYTAKIVETARTTALAWIAEHPEHVAAGELYRASMDVYSGEAQIKRLEPEYLAAKKNLAAARKRLAAAQAKVDAL